MRPLALLFLLTALQCRPDAAPEDPGAGADTPLDTLHLDTVGAVKTIDYLALGDSYTKGQGLPESQSFPRQIADSVRLRGLQPERPRIIAQTGWRTDNLLQAITSPANTDLQDSTFDLVTLCIGVNNQYQNTAFNLYPPQFEQLLQYAVQRAGNRPDHVVVLSIPDYAFTPFGQYSANPAATSSQIDQYNAVNRQIAEQYGAHYLDVTAISRLGLQDPTLVASDGLHPSARQYAWWVEKMLPALNEILNMP